VCASKKSEEDMVKIKIMGTPKVQYKTCRGDKQRALEDNIGVQLLSQFDSETEDDDEEEDALDMASVEHIIEEKVKQKKLTKASGVLCWLQG
jgi:predicted esterase